MYVRINIWINMAMCVCMSMYKYIKQNGERKSNDENYNWNLAGRFDPRWIIKEPLCINTIGSMDNSSAKWKKLSCNQIHWNQQPSWPFERFQPMVRQPNLISIKNRLSRNENAKQKAKRKSINSTSVHYFGYSPRSKLANRSQAKPYTQYLIWH